MNIEDVDRSVLNRMHSRLQRTIIHDKNVVRKNPQQKKLSVTTPVVKVTDTAKSQQSKLSHWLKKHQGKQMKPTNFSVKFGAVDNSKPSIDYKSKQKVSVLDQVVNESVISRSLFISDQPVVVKNVNFWMEAGKTRSDEERQQSEAGFARHAFNQYASDRLGYFREIPDTRHTL